LLVVVLQVGLFGIAWPVAVLAVVLAYFLAIVAGRVAGETGIGMVGPMGKVAQLVVGGVSGTAVPTLMAANVAGGAASQCSDLLGDYKRGRILGATPRAQTIAQVWGAVVGALAGAAAYMVLLPDPVANLAGEQWPAPAMRIWKSMAELLASGPEALPAGALTAVGYAAAGAVLLVVIRGVVPEKVKPWVPSPSVLGLAFVVPAYMSIMLFVGGALAGLAGWLVPDFKRRLWVVICAGIVAGESILELGQALARALG